jgi:hypothetical protein
VGASDGANTDGALSGGVEFSMGHVTHDNGSDSVGASLSVQPVTAISPAGRQFAALLDEVEFWAKKVRDCFE